MPPCSAPLRHPPHRPRLARAARPFLLLLAAALPILTAAAEAKRRFDVPAGPAEQSLKLFATQAGRGVIFNTDSVKDVRTNLVRGEFTSAAAIGRLVEGTALVVTPDEKTGAFAVRRGSDPNADRAERASPLDRPTAAPRDDRAAPAARAAGTNADTLRDETLVLSPFEVSTEKDVGYTAASSAMGGRLNTALEDTAASVSILNEQFLQDLAVATLTDAAEWAPNAVNVYRDAANPFQDYAVAIRNLGPSYQTSKNFFRYYINPDAFFTERIDFGRGPNSLVFGDTGVAGAFNVSSKRARPKAFQRVEAQAFSTGGYRAGFDVNQPVHEKLHLRAVYLRQDSDGWQDFERTKFEGAAATFTWKPFRRTTVWGEYEYGYRRTVQANGVYDFYSAWDRTTTVSAPLAANPAAATGLSRITTARYVFNPANPGLGTLNYQNSAETNGTNIRLAPRGFDAPAGWGLPAGARNRLDPIADYGFSANFPGFNFSNKLRGATVVVEQQFSEKFFGEIGLNRVWSATDNNNLVNNMRQVKIDVNRTLPDGRANPYFNQPYVEAFSSLPQAQYRDPLEGRASLAYVDHLRLAEVRALVGVNFRDDPFDIVRMFEAYTSGPSPDLSSTANRLHYRRYLSELHAPATLPPDAVRFVNGNTSRSDKYNRSGQAMVSTKWFASRRLLTSIGYRYETVKNESQTAVTDPVTRVFTGWTPKRVTLDASTDNLNYNAILRVTPWLSLYGGYAESFEYTGGSTSLDNQLMPMIGAEGVEFGARFNLLQGRVTGSVVYYQNERLNQRLAGASGDINEIWTDLGPAFSDRQVPAGYSDTQSWRGTGLEFEVVANPTRNWRVMANLSLPKAEQIDGYGATTAYFAATLPVWQAELARLGPAANPQAVQRINTNISDVRNRIESFAEGRTLNDSYDYTANLFANYTFSTGRLKNLSAGAGINLRGDRLVGNYPSSPFDYIWGDGYATVTARLGYQFKVRRSSVRLQVNVRNLLDQQQPALANNAYGTINYIDDTGVARTAFGARVYTVEPPRSLTLTASLQF